MSVLLRSMLTRYMAPAGEGKDGGGGGGAVDRGDDFTPSGDDASKNDTLTGGDDTVEGGGGDDTVDGGDDTAEGGDDEDLTEEEKAEKAAAAKAADKGKDGKKDSRIPLSRHKEILKKEREARESLEKQLAQFQGGKTIAETNDQITKDEDELIKLETTHAQLVTDGKHQEAAQTMTKIRKMERGIIESKSAMAVQAAEARAVERVRYDTTLSRLETAFPVLNPDHDDYDEGKVEEILDLKAAYQLRGYTPSEALQKAAKLILPPTSAKQEAATTVKPTVDEEAAKKKLADERRQAQLKKNLETKQPPGTKGVGADSDKAGGGPLSGEAVLRMKYDDFVKVDEETLSRLRGDTI